VNPLWEGVWDVAVIGGGNAALVSALAAADEGARVVVLERAPAVSRGGNSRHTRNVRCVHSGYPYDELWRDLCGVGTGPSDEALAAQTVRESQTVPDWMTRHGARWQPALRGTLSLARANRFFLGGGKALLNAYYRRARLAGVTVAYESTVTDLVFDGPLCTDAVVDGEHRLRAKAFVCASGGFEANIDWLRRIWGDAALNYHIRGPRTNDGAVLARLLDAGALPAGQERGFHAVAVDARSPKFDGGIATRLDTVPFGIVVNAYGVRFADEGEDIWPKRYASWGRHIAGQPDQIAYSIWDSAVHGRFLPPMYGAYQAASVADLARLLALDPDAVEKTVASYNAATPGGEPRPDLLDSLSTVDLDPPKSNWAGRIEHPPFYAVPMRPGITFTYLGVAVTPRGQVRLRDGGTLSNVYAAGELMSGNVLSTGYLAGFGMTIGTVWGRIAGREAAHHALG
jgi:tricarballylate dehydrogenase